MSPHKYLADLYADKKMYFEYGIWWIKKILFLQNHRFSLKFKKNGCSSAYKVGWQAVWQNVILVLKKQYFSLVFKK